MLELEGRKVFAEVYGPPPRLLVYGAVDTAESLAAAAKLLGWTTIVADARAKFATRERIPSADELIVAWPEETFAQVAPDHATAIVLLTHDDKFDLPALELALASDAFYVGLIGGRRNQEKKRERLRELGVDETSIERIAGPCGLDIGADAVPEVALSILAEAVAARNGRERRAAQPIGATDPRRGGMKTRAAVMLEAGRLEIEEIELEEPLPGEVVVRMSAVGVCGTDLHSYKGEWNRPMPIVLGHEGAGVIEAVGGEDERAAGGRTRRSLLGACLRRVRAVPPRPAGGVRAALIGDRPRDAAGRTHRDVARWRDRLSRHCDGCSRRAGRRCSRRGDAAGRRRADSTRRPCSAAPR